MKLVRYPRRHDWLPDFCQYTWETAATSRWYDLRADRHNLYGWRVTPA
jgi:hypothetical protein